MDQVFALNGRREMGSISLGIRSGVDSLEACREAVYGSSSPRSLTDVEETNVLEIKTNI